MYRFMSVRVSSFCHGPYFNLLYASLCNMTFILYWDDAKLSDQLQVHEIIQFMNIVCLGLVQNRCQNANGDRCVHKAT